LLSRIRKSFEYIANFDFDEMIIPEREYKLTSFLSNMERKYPWVETYVFTEDFFPAWEKAKNKKYEKGQL